MNPVKIGFVGVGSMGQCAHLKNYVRLEDCEVVALAEIRPAFAREVASRYGVSHVYDNHQELLKNESLDGIVASQPFNRHGVLIPELAEAGVPIFTEKPLACSPQVGQNILNALEDAGVWQMVGYHKLSDPATMYVLDEIARLKKTGELGELKYVRILMPEGDWVAGGFDDLINSDEDIPEVEWDAPPADMDEETYEKYTAFVNYYIHQVNLMRNLLGEPYRVAYASTSGVLMAVESESGIDGVIEMTPYRTTMEWEESALVAFERGYIRLELPAPLASHRAGTVEIYRDPGGDKRPVRERPAMPRTHAMKQQAKNFIRALRGETDPPCEAEEAIEDLKVAKEYIQMKNAG